MTEIQVQIVNELGLHLRAAARFVDAASRFPCRVAVSTGGPAIDGKSLLALSSLLARRGTLLTIRCDGADEELAARTLHDLVASGFPGTAPR
jgi:phosphocarrier protein